MVVVVSSNEKVVYARIKLIKNMNEMSQRLSYTVCNIIVWILDILNTIEIQQFVWVDFIIAAITVGNGIGVIIYCVCEVYF